jgi:hypothetical protein
VSGLARRHARRGEQHADLVQIGSIGLINAIDRFDSSREAAARARRAAGRIPRTREAPTARLGREPSPAELAGEPHAGERRWPAVALLVLILTQGS